MTKKIALAGEAAEGSGALTGWNGLGYLSRGEMAAALEEAGLPADWAPKAKSDVAYAGQAVKQCKNLGFFTRRARGAKWTKESTFSEKTREYRARWIVARNLAKGANVGDAAGEVVVTVELRDDSGDELVIDAAPGGESLAARIRADYHALRDKELFKAGHVTKWLVGILVTKCGAARYAMGYYVPASGRAIASKLVEAVSRRWGTNWASPLLPVATSDELRMGIARGFFDEVAGVARSLQSARETAREEKRAEVTPGVAARLLRELIDVDSRAAAYRVLVGDEILAPAVAELRKLRDELEPLSDDASKRFSLLDLSQPPVTTPAPKAKSPAEKAADAIVDAKLAAKDAQAKADDAPFKARYRRAQESSGMDKATFRATCKDVMGIKAKDATPQQWCEVAERVAKAATLVDEDMEARFGNLELD